MENLNYYLKQSKDGHYAIGHFNFSTEDVLKGIVEASRDAGAPAVMVGTSEGESIFIGMKEAVALAREGKGPIFIECKTYRQSGHSKNDARLYRTKEEEEKWKQKDPISRYKEILKEKYGWSEEKIELAVLEAEKEVETAIQYAEESNFPNKNTVNDYRWAE